MTEPRATCTGTAGERKWRQVTTRRGRQLQQLAGRRLVGWRFDFGARALEEQQVGEGWQRKNAGAQVPEQLPVSNRSGDGNLEAEVLRHINERFHHVVDREAELFERQRNGDPDESASTTGEGKDCCEYAQCEACGRGLCFDCAQMAAEHHEDAQPNNSRASCGSQNEGNATEPSRPIVPRANWIHARSANVPLLGSGRISKPTSERRVTDWELSQVVSVADSSFENFKGLCARIDASASNSLENDAVTRTVVKYREPST